MKNKFLFFFILIFFCYSFSFAETNQYTIDTLIKGIKSVGKPYISNGYIVFTAEDNARHVGIAFDNENFKTIHSFERLVAYTIDNEKRSSILFFLYPLPENSDKLNYKLIIDGLWTTDPLNPMKEYNKNAMTWTSTISYPDTTKNVTKTNPNLVTFVYEGETGQKIRLAGNFTNWDSFIYYLKETKPGYYELEIPLASGTYYYSFFNGLEEILDKNNSEKVFTPEGRMACVVTVP